MESGRAAQALARANEKRDEACRVLQVFSQQVAFLRRSLETLRAREKVLLLAEEAGCPLESLEGLAPEIAAANSLAAVQENIRALGAFVIELETYAASLKENVLFLSAALDCAGFDHNAAG